MYPILNTNFSNEEFEFSERGFWNRDSVVINFLGGHG